MARMTITLNDDRHRALKEAAARQGRTIGQIIDESLELYGIKSRDSVEALVERARRASGLPETEALRVAVDETRRARRE